MVSLAFRHPCLILDASCAINLYASGRMENILDSIPVPVAIAEYVSTVEVRTIYTYPRGGTPVKEAIDLQAFVRSGKLRVVPLAPGDEEVTVLNFAASLDDGEAITGAMGLHRQWAIYTDPRNLDQALRWMG